MVSICVEEIAIIGERVEHFMLVVAIFANTK